MKKMILAAVLALTTVVCFAEEKAVAASSDNTKQYNSWTFLQIGFFPGVPAYVNDSMVCGIKTGWPISAGNGSFVDGWESSWIYSGTDRVYGVQSSISVNVGRVIRGMQAAVLMNFVPGPVDGVQASCILNMAFEVTGMQAGALNIARQVNGFQPGVLGNITEEMNGFQAGLYNISKKLDGVQAAPLFNIMKDAGDTFCQLGLLNISNGDKGFQFGLINIIKGSSVPFMPLLNFAF